MENSEKAKSRQKHQCTSDFNTEQHRHFFRCLCTHSGLPPKAPPAASGAREKLSGNMQSSVGKGLTESCAGEEFMVIRQNFFEPSQCTVTTATCLKNGFKNQVKIILQAMDPLSPLLIILASWPKALALPHSASLVVLQRDGSHCCFLSLWSADGTSWAAECHSAIT